MGACTSISNPTEKSNINISITNRALLNPQAVSTQIEHLKEFIEIYSHADGACKRKSGS